MPIHFSELTDLAITHTQMATLRDEQTSDCTIS